MDKISKIMNYINHCGDQFSFTKVKYQETAGLRITMITGPFRQVHYYQNLLLND